MPLHGQYSAVRRLGRRRARHRVRSTTTGGMPPGRSPWPRTTTLTVLRVITYVLVSGVLPGNSWPVRRTPS
ncbi:hypothetical protein HBB16_21235 [Pseudonocardia sp. MCCB 268]|nr:hypothetical protein [Pseudonocardia cytotoxica]